MDKITEPPLFCILSTDTAPPKEAKDLWSKTSGGAGICMKIGYRYKGVMYNVFFTPIDLLKRLGGGYMVSWPFLRNHVEFKEERPGLLKGFYVGIK